jgi:hypothetical protein
MDDLETGPTIQPPPEGKPQSIMKKNDSDGDETAPERREYKRVQSWRDKKAHSDSDTDEESYKPVLLSPSNKRNSPRRAPSVEQPFSAPKRSTSTVGSAQPIPQWGIDTLNSLMSLSKQLNDVIADLNTRLNEGQELAGPQVVKISAKRMHDYKKAFEAFDTDNSGFLPRCKLIYCIVMFVVRGY